MVFSSLPFLLCFLPLTVLLYQGLAARACGRAALCALLLASLLFYAWWKPANLYIILLSLLGNYLLGQWLAVAGRWRKALFVTGLGLNLGALVWFKYTDFLLGTVNSLCGMQLPLTGIVLPIGISFFTFQQIAYLSDIYTGKHDPAGEGMMQYGLFVCFFPQLVAGPIVHHGEMMPQFARTAAGGPAAPGWTAACAGLTLLFLGLGKKVLIADTLSPVVSQTFDSAAVLTFCDALCGSLAYTFQLYFDFSGYSDMAVGCGLLFGVYLPQNFASPYRAESIQDFWRRWHITLSRWLRDYLYIPLGGNRKGRWRTLFNLWMTFLLGGLWHGAAWTFVLWGAMHGTALALHRLWSAAGHRMPRRAAWLLTFVFINLAWVVFRAPDFERLGLFCSAFSGQAGFAFSAAWQEAVSTRTLFGLVPFPVIISLLPLLLALCLRMPSAADMTAPLLAQDAPAAPPLRLTLLAALSLALSLFILCVPESSSEFIYFQF